MMDYDAIYYGAVGWPETVPDHVTLGLADPVSSTIRAVRLSAPSQVNARSSVTSGESRGRGYRLYVVRENSEGEYSSVGGIMNEGTERELVLQESVFTRRGVDRIMRYAFELAKTRAKRHVTSATKSNGISISMPYWDRRFEEISRAYPECTTDKYHIDILTAHFVMNPDRFDVVVASNLFGDILSDLGPACTGTIGIAPSANINPERNFPSLFEPVHGSAPDIFGKNIANPIGMMIWSGAMMLDHLGEVSAAADIMTAIEEVLETGPRTPDMRGNANAKEVGYAIAEAIS